MKTTLHLYALTNELKLERSGNAAPAEIVIPYGTWPYGMKEVEGRKLFVVQRLDQKGAIEIANTLNTAVAKKAPGLPVYWGHPDAPAVAANFPDKRAKAWIRSAEATATGLRLFNIEWLEDPAGGFGWYSPYWYGPGKPTDGHNAIAEIKEIVSIGLTNQPNIHEFRLANEVDYEPQTATSGTAAPTKEEEVKREQLLEALGLPSDATDEQIIAAIAKLKAAAADAATKVEAANAETAAEKEEKEELKEALANERQARTDLLLDQAIAEQKISVAARPAWAKRLAEDPKAGAIALANEKPLKTTSSTGHLKQGGSTTGETPIALVNAKVRQQGISFNDAWIAVKRERPDLFK